MSGTNISQTILVKRPQHNLRLGNSLMKLLEAQIATDVSLFCDDGQISAHRLVLAANSSYFRNLFSRMNNAFHYPNIVLREMSVNDLKTIIQFIYHGEVSVPQDRVTSLMKCADYLQIDGMASSANSLNAVLASSSMSHHALLTAHGTAPISATTNTISTYATTPSINKAHPQYLPANCKPSRGHSSRSNHASSNNSNNTTSDNSNKPKHTCPVCLKTFTHGFTLKRHMKLHSSNRNTITCDACSKTYSCKDSFLRHKKSSGHLQHSELFQNHRSIDMKFGSDR